MKVYMKCIWNIFANANMNFFPFKDPKESDTKDAAWSLANQFGGLRPWPADQCLLEEAAHGNKKPQGCYDGVWETEWRREWGHSWESTWTSSHPVLIGYQKGWFNLCSTVLHSINFLSCCGWTGKDSHAIHFTQHIFDKILSLFKDKVIREKEKSHMESSRSVVCQIVL